MRILGLDGQWGGTEGRTDGRTDGRKDGRTDGRLEITPCVLQDIGPLEPLPKKKMIKIGNKKEGKKEKEKDREQEK